MGYSRHTLGARLLAVSAAALALHCFWLRRVVFAPQEAAQDSKNPTPGRARLTAKELGYKPEIMHSGLLQPAGPRPGELEAAGLEFAFEAQNYNHEKALVLDMRNPAGARSSLSVHLPAGMVFAPVENRDVQNLVLRNAVSVNLQPGQAVRLETWAFCGNEWHMSPWGAMQPSGWVMKAPACQACVWRATAPYETAVPYYEGAYMQSKLGRAILA
eukprot:TRINITY_DN32796_c0_g1_i1.p1 TRINITY_DN32796_c0_g1~~TRINITY_DN32796_c0_g1_i1.p1  ORF type:complete len:234 (-),score=34.87 TRINITY_DN32796_c0_g1_i1:69-713(-)